MSTLELKNRLPLVRQVELQTVDAAIPLRWHERALMAVGVFEIPLQIDKYYMFHSADADLGAVAGINISVTTVAFALLYVFWLIDIAVRYGQAQRIGSAQKLVIGLPMLFYIGTVVLSLTVAKVKLLALFDVALLIQAYFVFYYLANRVRTKFDLKFLQAVIFATAIFQSLLMLGQKAIGESLFGQRFYFGPLALVVWEDGRTAGSMHSAVLAGSFLATLILPALAVFITPLKGWLKWAAMATVVISGLGILATQTRGAILTTGLGSFALVVACLARGWLPKRLIGLGVLIAIVSSIPLAKVIKDRVQSDDNGSAEARIHLSAIALELIKDKPYFGYGAGNCHLAALKYADKARYRSLWYYTVHNKYLLVWIETGLLGLVAFLVMVSTGLRDGFYIWRRRDRFLAPLGFGFAVAILGQMLHMNVDIFNSRTQVQLLWAMLGAVAAIRVISDNLKGSEFESESAENEEIELLPERKAQWAGGSQHG